MWRRNQQIHQKRNISSSLFWFHLFVVNSGAPDPFSPLILGKGSYSLVRPSLFHYASTPEEYQRYRWRHLFLFFDFEFISDFVRRLGDVIQWVLEGKMKIQIGGIYQLNDAVKAHEDLEGRGTVGKLLLRVGNSGHFWRINHTLFSLIQSNLAKVKMRWTWCYEVLP